jgi:hypothetical protein
MNYNWDLWTSQFALQLAKNNNPSKIGKDFPKFGKIVCKFYPAFFKKD